MTIGVAADDSGPNSPDLNGAAAMRFSGRNKDVIRPEEVRNLAGKPWKTAMYSCHLFIHAVRDGEKPAGDKLPERRILA